jgi:hypothetical protein
MIYLVTAGVAGKATSCLSTFAKVATLLTPLKGVVANYFPGSEPAVVKYIVVTYDHFVDQDAQRPPIHCRGVSVAFDNLWSDVLYATDINVYLE